MDGFGNPQKRISRLLLLSLLLINFSDAKSDNAYGISPFPPRISIWGYEGTLGLAKGDALIPLAGNEDNIFYSDIQSKYATDDSAFLGASVGFRHVVSDARILGAYVFLDNSRSEQHDNFWFVSPGIESLGNLWDFHGNVYIPVSKEQQYGGTEFADQLGNYNFVYFTGHDQYDHLFDIYDKVGPGTDAEIGRIIPGLPNLRAYAGGYYFSIHNANDVTGAEARLEYTVNQHITLEAENSYDNVFRDSAELGVRLTIGAVNKQQVSSDIQARILDPITRNLSTISSGATTPIVQYYHDHGNMVLERSNIYFFSGNSQNSFNPNAGANNCTFEHPCNANQFNQSMLNAINSFAPNASFYLSSGDYSLDGQLDLAQGQSIFGRQDNYREPAEGDNRPILYGSLALNGNNTLDSLQLMNDGTQINGITVTNANNITINNSIIGGENNLTGYQTAITLMNAQNIIIDDSVINAYKDFPYNDFTVNGIVAQNSSVVINNSTLNVTAKGDMTNEIDVYGINAENSQITMNASQINLDANATATTNLNADAIFANSSLINIYKSTLNVLAKDDASDMETDVISSDITLNDSDLTIKDSTLNNNTIVANQDGFIIAGAYGISESNSLVNAKNNTFNVNATTSGTYLAITAALGIYEDGGSLNLSDNTFNVTGNCSTIVCEIHDIYSGDENLMSMINKINIL